MNISIDPIGAAAGIIGSGINYFGQQAINDRNEAFINEQNDKNWTRNYALQHEAWARDDNKYGRLVKDLKNAGINPMLATGNPTASQSSPAVSSGNGPSMGSARAPQVDPVSFMQMSLLRSQAKKADTDAYIAGDTYERQKAAGILPGADPMLARIDQILDRFGETTSSMMNKFREGLDSAAAWLKDKFSQIPDMPSLATIPTESIKNALQSALDNRDPNPTEDNKVDRIKSAIDALLNNRAPVSHQQFPAPAREPFPDPSIDAGSARSSYGRRNVPTRPRNNLK